VLVVDVPERALVEDALDVGQLEQHDRVEPVADAVADHPHEPGHVGDVLERVPADDRVGLQRPEALVVELGAGLDAVGQLGPQPLGVQPGVDADDPRHAGLDQVLEELALAAADLDGRAAGQVVLLDPVAGQPGGELDELAGVALGLLVAGGVLGQARVEGHVGEEPARRAEAELHVAAGVGDRLLDVEQQAAVGGDAPLAVEHRDGAGPAGRAGVGGRGAHGTTSGDGTGTMKRPPRAMYSACWARISSRKFQASSSTSSGCSSSRTSGGRTGWWVPGMSLPCLWGLRSTTYSTRSVPSPAWLRSMAPLAAAP